VVDGRPTLETVARRAAVSRQTVSNVLNSPHLVRPETLQRVREAIDAVGYRPNAAARQLRTQRSRVIGMRIEQVVDGINGAVLDRFLHALTEQAQLHGYRLMLFAAPDDQGEIAQYGELLDGLQLDAFVLTSTHAGDLRTQWLTDHDVPFVTFGRPWDDPSSAVVQPDHAWVDVDGAVGTRAAVEHLQALGHHRIAWIGWPEGSGVGDDRRAGWGRAMSAAGTDPADVAALEVAVDDGVAQGAHAAAHLLATTGATAFVCASDSLALGALGTARGGAVLDSRTVTAARPDVAVVGFDDTPVARAVGLSSVAQPLTEAARAALDLLLMRLSDRDHRDHHVLLAPSLVIRDSSRATTGAG
jgi:DNA-binding LacI/PurR family transcriptional regulator